MSLSLFRSAISISLVSFPTCYSHLHSGIGLTAYTLGALIEGGLSPSDEHIQRGLSFILPENRTVFEALDTYSLLQVANTLTLLDVTHPRLAEIISTLEARKRGDSGIRFWSNSPVGAAVTSTDIEMTSYALLTYATLGKIDECVEMTRWLTQQRNGKGGFLSTQDTVMGLQALARISEILYAKTGNFHVKFESVDQTQEFNLNQVHTGKRTVWSYWLKDERVRALGFLTGFVLFVFQIVFYGKLGLVRVLTSQ